MFFLFDKWICLVITAELEEVKAYPLRELKPMVVFNSPWSSVVNPHHVDADPDPDPWINIGWYGSDPDPRIRIGKKLIRIRIQLLVNDFCEFYFPCYVFPSLYFRFLKRLLLYIINLIRNHKILIFCPIYFGCSLCYPDLFSPSWCGSGSGQMIRVRPDPDPQHCLEQSFLWTERDVG